MSSSGLVRPSGASVRAGQVTSYVPSLELSRLTLPAPSVREPSQWAVAVRVVAMRGASWLTDGGSQVFARLTL